MTKSEVLFQYKSLLEEKKGVERKLARLKTKVLFDKELSKSFLRESNYLDFKLAKDFNIKDIPAKLLKLDTSKISEVYRSALGGDSFLKDLKLSLVHKTRYAGVPLSNIKREDELGVLISKEKEAKVNNETR